MPFTPLHMGPGLAIKALAGRHFSLLSFAIAQLAMDIGPLINLLRGVPVLHGPSHSYAAALIIAALVAILPPPLAVLILPVWSREPAFHRLSWPAAPRRLGATAAITGALAGTLSHVLLDSLMHADMASLAPWDAGNGLLGAISYEALHRFCVLTGVLGFIGWLVAAWRKRPAGAAD
jgi:hypothetical protein